MLCARIFTHHDATLPLGCCLCAAEMPRSQSSIVEGLRAHSNRKVGNVAAEALATAVDDELLEVTSERLDGVMLMVGD